MPGVEKAFWMLSQLWVMTPNFLGYTVLDIVGQPGFQTRLAALCQTGY